MAKHSSAKQSRSEAKSDPAVSYNDFKEYEGQRYTGIKIGRSHKWNYDPGEWKEKKITPDLWQIGYAVTNDYTTSLTGLKFKIAHKRAGSEKWSATPKTQRRRMITFLQSVIADLEKQIDSAGDVISAQEKPAVPAQRKVRRPRSMMNRATRRRHQ